MPDIEAIRAAAREARTGELPDVVQGPVINAPVWTWEIPLYFWFGGIAAGSSFVALACDLAGDDALGADRAQGRARRADALAAAADHGPRAARALLQHAAHLQAALADVDGRVGAERVRRARRGARSGPTCSAATARRKLLGGANAIVGGYLGSYTGVLLASTAVPVWARSRLFLGPIFVSTATATGAAATRLALVATGLPVGHPTRHALGTVETGAMTAELLLSIVNERRLGPLGERRSRPAAPGTLFQAAKWAVRAGLALRLARKRGGPRRHHLASLLYLAAGPAVPLRLGRRGQALGARRPRRGRDAPRRDARHLTARLKRAGSGVRIVSAGKIRIEDATRRAAHRRRAVKQNWVTVG